jgi:hypothetical protein
MEGSDTEPGEKAEIMKAGFAKNDITPRVGVELCGFGPFRCRHSIGVRDRLWARAAAVEQGGRTVLVISCDLIGVTPAITARVRERVGRAAGLKPADIMIACSHTHSGPSTKTYIGWGEMDPPYVETLPARIAKAGLMALERLEEAELVHAETPCPDIGLNREYDQDAPPLEECLRPDWRPAKPELTDTTCRVLAWRRPGGRLLGFASYFGCHPVVCCAATRFIHGDYAGVATNLVERDYDGDVVGLFFQGAQGDVNTCVVHKPEQESMLALDVIAGRYARAVRRGLAEAAPAVVDRVDGVSRQVRFSRKPWGLDKLRALLAEKEERLAHPDATDTFATADWRVATETVQALALRSLIARAERGENPATETELQGIRIGPVALLGNGFEMFQAIKNEVRAAARAPVPLVMGLVNDSVGYAPDRTAAARGGYAADFVPLMIGQIPYAKIHEELVQALIELDHALFP